MRTELEFKSSKQCARLAAAQVWVMFAANPPGQLFGDGEQAQPGFCCAQALALA